MARDGLRELVEEGNGGDRAYVDAMIRMRWSRTRDASTRADLLALHDELRRAALRAHDALRTEIATAALRGPALRVHFDSIAVLDRDHYVEEVLGIAYPPLDDVTLEPELVTYSPSGYDEIVHAFDVVELRPKDRFFDLGSGMGKAVLLAAVLADAEVIGLELDRRLHDLAAIAARDLRIASARFHHGDARTVDLEDADVFFMYIPFTGNVLGTVMTRLLENGRRDPTCAQRRYLCAGALDTSRYSELTVAGPPRSWLHVYAWS